MQLATQPQSLMGLVGQGYGFFGQLFTKLLPINILLMVIITPIVMLAMFIGMAGVSGFHPVLLGIGVVLLALLFIWLTVFFYGALYVRGYGVMAGDASLLGGASWRLAKQRSLRGLGGMVLLGLIMMALGVLAFGLTTAAGYLSAFAVPVVGVLCGLFFIYVSLRLSFTVPLIFIHNQGPATAVSKSFKLAKSFCWRIFVVFFLLCGIPAILFTLVGLLLDYLMISVPMASAIAHCVLTIIQNVVLPVFFITAPIILMNDLALRKSVGNLGA